MSEESEDADEEGIEYEHERLASRDDAATVLRRVADGVADGSVAFDDGRLVAAVPERVELEVEYEQGDDEAEIELELEWPVVDGEAVPADEATEDEDDDDEEAEEDEEEADETAEAGDEDGDHHTASEAAAERPVAEVVSAGDAGSKARFELYRDRADEWRWRLVHHNGNIIADSGEGYGRKAGARNGLESVMANAPGAVVEVQDD